MTKLAKKKPATKKPAVKGPAKTRAKKSVVNKTDKDNKRRARNEALRAWRKANRERVIASMRSWHAAKRAAQKKDAPNKKAVTK
jgi:hypothetical protein